MITLWLLAGVIARVLNRHDGIPDFGLGSVAALIVAGAFATYGWLFYLTSPPQVVLIAGSIALFVAGYAAAKIFREHAANLGA